MQEEKPEILYQSENISEKNLNQNKVTSSDERRKNFDKALKSASLIVDLPNIDFSKENKKGVKQWARNTIRGSYTNVSSGKQIDVGRQCINEILNHDTGKNDGNIQFKSLVFIPEIVKNAVFIGTLLNEDSKVNTDYFDYYASNINIDGTDYVVRSVTAELNNGNRYYDHKLTKKEELERYWITTPGFSLSSSQLKDKRLVSLLQEEKSGCRY